MIKEKLINIISKNEVIHTPHFKKHHLQDYHNILKRTKYLPENCKFTERVYQIINDLYERPKCQICNKEHVNFRSLTEGYKKFCCVKCAALGGQTNFKQTIKKRTEEEWDEINNKKRFTLKHKFFNKLLKSNRLKDLAIPLFSFNEYQGTKESGRRLKNKYKFKCVKCGNIFFDNLDDGKIPRCFNCYPVYFWGNTSQKGNYEGFRYDSSWELAFIKYCLNNNIQLERNKKGFDYWFEDKKHKYYPDFYLPEVNQYIEIKNKYLLELEQTKSKINQFSYKLDIYDEEKMKFIFNNIGRQ